VLVLASALVTGGAGFIGFHLSKKLAEKGYDITIVDNLFRGKYDDDFTELINRDNVNFINADLTSKDTYKKLDNYYDYIYHLAAINGTKYFYEIPYKVLRNNTLSTIYLLDWASDKKCKKIVFSSTCETYAGTKNKPIPTPENVSLTIDDVFNPRWSYAGSKILGELLFTNYSREYELVFSIARIHNVYGPRDSFEHVIPEFIKRIIKKEDPFKIVGPNPTRSFCYIDDCVDALLLIGKSDKANGEIFNVGNPNEIKIIELANLMFDLFDFRPSLKLEPEPPGCTMRRVPNISKIKNVLGFEPKVDLKEGLKKTFEWYLKNLKE